MRKKWRKLTACALAAALGAVHMSYPIYAEEPTFVEMEEPCGEENSVEEQPESPVCICETKCAENAVNEECPVCAAKNADLTLCTGEEIEEEVETVPEETETKPEETKPEETKPEETKPEETEPEETEPEETEPEETEPKEPETDPETKPEEMETLPEEAENMLVPYALEMRASNTFNINESSVEITESGTYTINGTGVPTTNTIKISYGLDVTVTLNNVNIDVSSSANACAFDIVEGGSNVVLILSGNNTLKSGANCAGLQFNTTSRTWRASLEIKGSGSLHAEGGYAGAGIGGGVNQNASKITISSGKIEAIGGDYAAGIGASYGRTGSNITINGGSVIATGGTHSAGIGGGNMYTASVGHGMEITINGGNVIATGQGSAAGIGGGENGITKDVKITTGTVTTNRIGSIDNNNSGSNAPVITGGSVKCAGFQNPPVNENQKPVYCFALEGQKGVNSVKIDDNVTFLRHGNHLDDGTFYLYLTGEKHVLTTTNGSYASYTIGWNGKELLLYPPTPTAAIASKTASSLTVTPLSSLEQDKYGTAEYSLDNLNWQEDNTFTELHSQGYNGTYTVYARYGGNAKYIPSDAGTVNASTNAANYTITIPNSALTAGDTNSESQISVSDTFDLGYNGHVDVKVANNDNVTEDAKLNLIRQGDTENYTITSALLIDGTPLGDISKNAAAFTMDSKASVSVSFEAPTETNIPAGTYNGTITFVVSYSEEGSR